MFEIGDRVRCITGGYEYTIHEIKVGRNGHCYIWGNDLPEVIKYYGSFGGRKKNWHNSIPKFTELVSKKGDIIYDGKGIKHKFI